MVNVQALIAAAQRETDVDTAILGVVTTMAANQKDLAGQLATAIANNDPVGLAAAQKAIDDSATSMTANADRIVEAIKANTPAAVPAP